MLKTRLWVVVACGLAGLAAIGVWAATNDALGVPGAEDYQRWREAHPAEVVRLQTFEALLEREGVAGVLPVTQVLRTDREWRVCGHTAFDLAPEADWPHMVRTLRFIRDEVVPAVGPVEVISGYREEGFNRCVGGAAKSAHRGFYALDMVPVDAAVSREVMIAKICAAHKRAGAAYDTGLGFYSGRRFHIDSKGYRRWGTNHKGGSSPCS